jgi:hypothetical protein
MGKTSRFGDWFFIIKVLGIKGELVQVKYWEFLTETYQIRDSDMAEFHISWLELAEHVSIVNLLELKLPVLSAFDVAKEKLE